MQLGAFSISLTVKDLAASRAFYEKLGFAVVGGAAEQNWLILRNADEVTIGLFKGLFERNLLTFNPGWDRQAKNLPAFEDVRKIQHRLEAEGLRLDTRADPKTSGPASLVLTDPDGNPILIDQHR
jgi:lactoylglutathione lyase